MNTSAFPGQTLQPLPANSGPVGDDEFSLLQKIAQNTYNASQGGSGGGGAPSGPAGGSLTGTYPNPKLAGEVDVALEATGGDGSSGNPWTGWAAAITWAGWTTYKFRTGHYSHDGSTNFLYEGIQLIGEAGVYIQSTGANYCFLMDASQVASDWVTNVRVENINVTGNGTTTQMGFMLVGVRNGIFKHLSAKNVVQAGLWSEACVTNTLENFRCTFNELTNGSGGAGPFSPKPQYGIVLTIRGDYAGSPVSNDWSTTWTITNPVIEGVTYYGIWIKDLVAAQNAYGHTIINGTCESLAQANLDTLTSCSYSTASYQVTCDDTSALVVGAWVNSDTNAHFNANTRILSIDDATHFTTNQKPNTTGTNNINIQSPSMGMFIESYYNTIISIDLEANGGGGDLLLTGSSNLFCGMNCGGYVNITGSHNTFINGQNQHIRIDGAGLVYPIDNSFINCDVLASFTDNGAYNRRDEGHFCISNGIGASLPSLSAYKVGNVLVNQDAAAAGAQQVSPVTRWQGYGWKTDATAASELVTVQAGIVPVQGAAHPSVKWALQTDRLGGSHGTLTEFFSVATGTDTYTVIMKMIGQFATTTLTQSATNFTITNGYGTTLTMALGGADLRLYSSQADLPLTLGNGGDKATKISRSIDGLEKGFWLYPADDAIMQLGENHATTATNQTIKAHNVTTGTGASLTIGGGAGSVAGGALNLATSVTNGALVNHITIAANGDIVIATSASRKIGFFNATPVVQQTAPVAITDSTGGSSSASLDACGDTSASDQSGTINNNFATVAARLADIRTLIVNLGLGA